MGKSVYLSPSMQEHNEGVAGYGTEEVRMNQVADVVERVLTRHGINVYRNKPDWTLQKVAQDSNNKKPNLHFAIHSNAGGGCGGEIYAYAPGGEGEKAARAIYSELEPITPTADRGVKFWPELYELRKTTAPAVLVEIAFHDNEDDAKWIIANIEKIGTALAKGVLKYFGIEFVSETYELEQAVKVLKEKGIISDPDYWIGNAVPGRIVRGDFAATLIKRAALVLKGGN
ncbi:MAG TPA: N-acetylmuramoyl-L-alanine amidase [Pseudobacteroides sp.]|uniref:N-acetylmuramoyl-L-alanine amidase family protein n=1 Tax=Pseudobacteroides sp. TaxID=1968840 RepID=UPI002F940C01